MAKKNKLSRGEKIVSTSDVTVDDLIECIADELPFGKCRENIEGIIRDTVPCTSGKMPTADDDRVLFANGVRGGGCASGGSAGVRITGSGSPAGIRVTVGVGDCTGKKFACTGCPGTAGVSDPDEVIKSNASRSPKLATTSEWFNAVLQNGEIWSPYTNRRFLPCQYLSMFEYYKGNIDMAIARRYNIKEMWKLLDTEIEKLIFMERKWRTAFLEREQFLTLEDIRTIFTQYLDGLSANINDRSKCEFKKRDGLYWRKIQGLGRIELWYQKEINHTGPNGAESATVSIEPMEWLVNLNNQIALARTRIRGMSTYVDALHILRNYMPKISMGTFRDSEGMPRYWLPKAWKECFKKQGAYYTLKSLIVNGHVKFSTESGDWHHKDISTCTTARESLNELAKLARHDVPAYVVHAILKKSMETSGFKVGRFLSQIRK